MNGPRLSLLVDSPAFRARLREDILIAREHVYVQTLSFEGDGAGRELTSLLLASGCPDRRLLVDTYSLVKVSDKFLYSPLRWGDRELFREWRRTGGFVRELRRDGVHVGFTNPMGPFLVRFPARNHKKLVVIDGRVAYIGGLNFSDHNFQWHDMMLRFDDPDLAQALRYDFEQTWGGRNLCMTKVTPGVELHIFRGNANERRFQRILDLIDDARDSIFVESAYVTFPFLDRLGAASRRGVEVTLVTPRENNFRVLRDYVAWECHRHGIDLRLYPTMTHLKAMLIDGRVLVVGSTNFDFVSYRLEQEIVALVTDPDLVAEFRACVLEPDLAVSLPAKPWIGGLRGRWRRAQLGAADLCARILRGA
ncbi:MAG: hypothetical protein Kow00122_14990 [Thermoleophilia bacterium]